MKSIYITINMLLRVDHLIKINAKNKIQIINLSLDQLYNGSIYNIYRVTGQYHKKEIHQPVITIKEGKAGRTIGQQALLQYNSILNNYKNDGYKSFGDLCKKPFDDCTEQELKNLFDCNSLTDTLGVPKPMLAKSSVELNSNIFEKDWYCSRKIDGTRCLMYFKDGIIKTASRGGKNYDIATTNLRKNPILIKLFQENPKLILDGELYKHGWPLQKISGLCRLKEWNNECGFLEYWVYDYISNESFKDRYKFLQNISYLFDNNQKIKILDHYKLSGFLSIKKLHDKFVQEGFEGLCARNPEKEYGIGKRSGTYLIKLKSYLDNEYEIIGIKEGLRDEDMCFILKTKEGKEFAAKPIGTADIRINYLKHKEDYIGKMATCKYFYLSEDGIPLQPIFKSIRSEEDLDV